MKKYFEKLNKFICPKCEHYFEISDFWKWLSHMKLFDIWRYIKCPNCSKWSWMKKVDKNVKQ